ncbi:AAA family ATPase [Paenibacillus chartarius]|uniref:AAA family ATPase n=1 Tax=Paenibacillus chartarius TaxID=747481 RepID=A0ABV6DTH0_9BACL
MSSSPSLWLDQPHVLIERIMTNVEKVILGKRDVVEKVVIALLCGGHLLLEDVPGVGKTMLVRAVSRTVGCDFKRIQGTPDLLPSDVTGVSVYNSRTEAFEFRPGPIMASIVLADELNRMPPKTQASLLEAMEEGRVTVDGVTYELPKPFLLLATQNPVDFDGTYPLPEAQLDRFLMKVSIGYPDAKHEVQLLGRTGERPALEALRPVLLQEELVELQREASRVHVDDSLKQYIVALASATRSSSDTLLGASPRATVALYKAVQARAFLQGRTYAIPDDVKIMTEPVFAHRLQLTPEARLSGRSGETVVRAAVGTVPIPPSSYAASSASAG